jgi:glycosyltransferase involved in cell wall biosynthesis
MHLCHVVPSLEDRHGGPSKSVRALANAMAASETTDLLTTLEAGQHMLPPAEDAAAIHVYERETPRWLCASTGLKRRLATTAYDVVHSHALWLLTLRYAHDAARRRIVPLVISPRGMMSGWAWEHRRWRKRLADWFVHPGAMHAATGWHATSEEEADDIRHLGFTQPICVAPNGVELPTPADLVMARTEWHREFPQLAQQRVALFYSRFHRKKRLRELIDLWLATAPADWVLLIAGVPEEYSLAEVQAWCVAAKERVIVADGRSRPAPFAAADLFLLPSHSENFGLVVAEALAAGVPALVTDTTPWSQLAARQAGDCVPWESYAATLRTLLDEDDDDLAARGSLGRAWVAQEFTWQGAAARLLEFYRDLKA